MDYAAIMAINNVIFFKNIFGVEMAKQFGSKFIFFFVEKLRLAPEIEYRKKRQIDYQLLVVIRTRLQ